MRAAALTIVLLALAATAASAAFEAFSVKGDLDGDGSREEARTVRVPNPTDPNDDLLAGTEVNIRDSCASGRIDRKVAGPQDSLALLKLYEADTRRGREVFVDLRSGASGRSGEAHLVAWRPSGGKGCGAPRDLFAYDSTRPSPRPNGAVSFNGFAVRVRQLERRFPGREIKLDQTYLRRGDAGCCPSLVRHTWLRYDGRRDKYVRYRRSMAELPNRR
jgi:hypothetical protein